MTEQEMQSHIQGLKDNPQIVKVSNIYGEHLFEWFEQCVLSSGGDGGSNIVCENYKDVATWFEEWVFKRWADKGIKYFHPRDEYKDIVNYHDSNENFVFTNKTCAQSGFFNWENEYEFIVEKDCRFYASGWRDRIIKGLVINSPQ